MKTIPTPRESASKEKIISEAIALAKEEGWKKVTVRAIADRLNYQPPVLYQFFNNKDHLIQNILEIGFEKLSISMKEAQLSAMAPEEQLLAMARARFRFAIDHLALHSLMFKTDSPTWFRNTVFTGLDHTHETLTKLVRKISGREDACLDLVTNFISLIKGYTFFATQMPSDLSEQRFFGSQNPEDALAEAMHRFITSIRPHE